MAELISGYSTFADWATDAADAVREKTESTEKIKPCNLPEAIRAIEVGARGNEFFYAQRGYPSSVVLSSAVTLVTREIESVLPPVCLGILSWNDPYLLRWAYCKGELFPYGTGSEFLYFSSVRADNALSIPSGAYSRGSARWILHTAIFPKCETIGIYAFDDCEKLSNISFPECKLIGNGAFRSCYSLKNANFPKCTTIEGNAFASCSSLSSLYFPNCETIGAAAFYRCSLANVMFPKCKSIGNDAFKYATCGVSAVLSFPACEILSSSAFVSIRTSGDLSFYFMGSSIPVMQGAVFGGNTPDMKIYVPSSLLASYKNATNWIRYSSQMVGV